MEKTQQPLKKMRQCQDLRPDLRYESNLTRLIASARNGCSRALVRLRVAASGGEARAQAALGSLYAYASPKARYKVTRQPEEAARWFRMPRVKAMPSLSLTLV